MTKEKNIYCVYGINIMIWKLIIQEKYKTKQKLLLLKLHNVKWQKKNIRTKTKENWKVFFLRQQMPNDEQEVYRQWHPN